MLALGLTGSIATGKSTVLEAFRALDVPIFSADAAVAEIYAGEATKAVEALFPGVSSNGRVDRQKLSQRLAADPSLFSKLEALVHPLVRARIKAFLAAQGGAEQRLAVVEVPLLLETGYDYGFDAIAVTHVDPAIQRRRALARPGMTVEKLEAILARQLPQAEKKQRATYLFDTGKGHKETQAEVAALVATVRSAGED